MPATTRIRQIAHLGSVAFVPYYACHLMRFANLPPFRGTRLADAGVLFIPAFILCTALPADFLLLGLVHSWGLVFPRWTVWPAGRRVPRFLPVVPVWLVAPTLTGYGTGMWIYLLISGPATFPDYLLSCAAATAFAGYGWALGVAAISYQRRTRPRCVLQPSSAARRSVMVDERAASGPALSEGPARTGIRRGQDNFRFTVLLDARGVNLGFTVHCRLPRTSSVGRRCSPARH